MTGFQIQGNEIQLNGLMGGNLSWLYEPGSVVMGHGGRRYSSGATWLDVGMARN
jgi:hypothetical protein